MDLEVLPFATTEDWEAWLREHHETATGGVWIKFARKASGIPTVTYRDALQVPGLVVAARAASGPSATATSPPP